MKQITLIVVFSAGLLLLTKLTAQSSPSTVITHARPDARRLRTGHFTYRSLDHGKNAGTGRITIQRLADSGNYDFSAEFEFAAEIGSYRSQLWESVATSEFEPISAALSFGKAAGALPVFDLKYTSGKVTGFAISRKDSDVGTKRSIDAALRSLVQIKPPQPEFLVFQSLPQPCNNPNL